jgi:hypothetical protein
VGGTEGLRKFQVLWDWGSWGCEGTLDCMEMLLYEHEGRWEPFFGEFSRETSVACPRDRRERNFVKGEVINGREMGRNREFEMPGDICYCYCYSVIHITLEHTLRCDTQSICICIDMCNHYTTVHGSRIDPIRANGIYSVHMKNMLLIQIEDAESHT